MPAATTLAPPPSSAPLAATAPALTTVRGKVLASAFAGHTLRQRLLWAVRGRTILRRVDLRGQDVSGLDLREGMMAEANFAGAICQWTNFAGANLRGANFRGADCRSAHFAGANLTGADFTDALLGGAEFDERDGTERTVRLTQTTPDAATLLARAKQEAGVRLRIDR